MIGFSNYDSIRRHPQNCLKSSAVSPQCIIKFDRLILSVLSDNLFQNELDLSIGDFDLPICLGMIRSRQLVIDGIFLQQSFKNSVAEMRSIITNYRSRGAKSGEDVFFRKFDNYFIIIRLFWHNIYPFRDIAVRNWEFY